MHLSVMRLTGKLKYGESQMCGFSSLTARRLLRNLMGSPGMEARSLFALRYSRVLTLHNYAIT